MSDSKNHHFIPQWQSKLWADENDRVNVVDRRDKNNITSYVTRTRNVFSQNYLYSIRGEFGENDDSLEKQLYGPLDDAAEQLTREILSILDRHATPKMNDGARILFWKFHFYNAFKRHPDSMKPYLDQMDYKALHLESLQNAINLGESIADVTDVIKNFDLKTLLEKEGVQYARAEQNNEVLQLYGKMGILFAVAPEKTSFLLPDRPFEIIPGKDQTHRTEEIWIPIHPKYAARLYLFDGKCNKLYLTKQQVRNINERWYSLANQVVSVSKKHLISFAKNQDNQKIVF